MKILIIEPDRSIRRTLSLIVRDMGHSSFPVGDTDQAIPFLNGFWPDVIIANYYLGDKTAVQFCDEVRSLFGEIPAVVIHSSVREHRFFALRFPEASFMNSPFSPDELQDHLASITAESWNVAG